MIIAQNLIASSAFYYNTMAGREWNPSPEGPNWSVQLALNKVTHLDANERKIVRRRNFMLIAISKLLYVFYLIVRNGNNIWKQ